MDRQLDEYLRFIELMRSLDGWAPEPVLSGNFEHPYIDDFWGYKPGAVGGPLELGNPWVLPRCRTCYEAFPHSLSIDGHHSMVLQVFLQTAESGDDRVFEVALDDAPFFLAQAVRTAMEAKPGLLSIFGPAREPA